MEQRHFQKKKKKNNLAKFGQENPEKVSEFYYSRSLITLIVVPPPYLPKIESLGGVQNFTRKGG